MSTLLIFLLVLSVLVFAHELGHFYVARKFGVKAEEFGFGLPPRIFGFYKNKNKKWKKVFGNTEVEDAPGTVYSLNWIPIGGFVKIKGQDGEEYVKVDRSDDERNDDDSYATKPVWKRFIIISAGVSMNIVLAAVLISVGLMIGFPQTTEAINPRAQVSEKKIQIGQVMKDSPAGMAGVKMSDTILSINGEKFKTSKEVQEFVKDKAGVELTYELARDGEIVELKITPEIREETGVGGVGIAIVETGIVKYPWYLAIYEGFKMTILITIAIVIAFYNLFSDLITGHGLSAEVAGPVGIAKMSGQFARMGITYLMQFSAMLSLNLAVLNFLPFPALDGGHAMFLLIEKIKGSPVKRELANMIHGVGMAVLLLLVLIVTFKDVIKLF